MCEDPVPKSQDVKQVCGSGGAFCAVLMDGSCVTWGEVVSGGDSRPVRERLLEVEEVHASVFAFAAILRDRNLVDLFVPPKMKGSFFGIYDKRHQKFIRR